MNSDDPIPRGVRIALATLARAAGAGHVVLYAPRPKGLALVAQIEIDQRAVDMVHVAWARKREQLEAGMIVAYGLSLVWPLFDGPHLVGLLYLDQAPDGFPDEKSRATAAVLAARLTTVTVASVVNSYFTTRLADPNLLDELVRDQTAVCLDANGGNVTQAARQLGISRQALHARAAKFGLDLDLFKQRHRRKR